MSGGALARRLKQRGAELGLGAVGIAAAGPSARAAFLDRWLAAGYAAAMSWMERTAGVRNDLRVRFPWVRSAVVAAVSYRPYEGDRQGQAGLVPHVARYAVGRDYHETLSRRLEALAAFLRAESDAEHARVYVDHGPVPERELAARAGLGWIGKNTNLIRPGGDSWVLLGEILTDLDLPPDGPVADRCGTCTACLDACPTGALPAPYLLDARRCLSYLSIELRDRAVPVAQRRDLADWLFGCDICQEVCPWNDRVPAVTDEAFLPALHLERMTLADLVTLDEASFEARFRPTPLDRPRRRGLARNALIVAANTRDERALAAAPAALRDPEPMVRATAAWALGTQGTASARSVLEAALEVDPDPEVRDEIRRALDDPGASAP